MRVVTFKEWMEAPHDEPQLVQLMRELVDSGRGHWFEFAIDERGAGLVRMSPEGLTEYKAEEQHIGE